MNENGIANYIITLANKEKLSITQLKLHKIMFFLQINYIIQHKDLLFHESFEAWEYGPVLYSQRQRFKNSKRDELIIDSDSEIFELGEYEDYIKKLLDMNPWKLVDASHENIFWKNAMKTNKIIDNNELLTYYGRINAGL